MSQQIATQLADESLQLVLEVLEPPPLPINMVCQGPDKHTAKLRDFVDFCIEELRRRTRRESAAGSLQ